MSSGAPPYNTGMSETPVAPVDRGLAGITVALLETRREREFRGMFEMRGAQVLSCPLIFPENDGVEPQVRRFIDGALAGEFQAAVFYTGLGVLTILEAARALGLDAKLRTALAAIPLIARGPKVRAALRREQLQPAALAEPATTEGLMALMAAMSFAPGAAIAVALAGDQPTALLPALRQRGFEVYDFPPYHYRLPDNLDEAGQFIEQLCRPGQVRWIAFTSQPQVGILFQCAETLGARERLEQALQREVRVASIGTVTTAALSRHGIPISAHAPAEQETMIGLVKQIVAAESSAQRQDPN